MLSGSDDCALQDNTGKRIQDKIAASKKKGMWMGGDIRTPAS